MSEETQSLMTAEEIQQLSTYINFPGVATVPYIRMESVRLYAICDYAHRVTEQRRALLEALKAILDDSIPGPHIQIARTAITAAEEKSGAMK